MIIKNVLELEVTFPKPILNLQKVQEAADLINNAKKPFIVFGQGIILSQAEEQLKRFVEKSGIPAAWTILGLSALPTEHPYKCGDGGNAR